MNTFKAEIKENLLFFFSCIGIIMTVYIGYMLFSPYAGGINFTVIDVWHTYLVALFFTASHFVLSSDWSLFHIGRKIRFTVSLLSAMAAAGILNYDIGLHHWLGAVYEGKPQGEAVLIFCILLLLSYAAMLLIWIIIIKKLKNQSEEINLALKEYQKKQKVN